MYNITDPLIKLNGDGPYKEHYNEAKAKAAEKHPDWTPKRCHNHALLLMAKLVLKRMWGAWNPEKWDAGEDERRRLGL